MARNGIQYHDVQQAIDALLARGDTPSVQRIRDVLGTGSFTTISDHFRVWRSEREQNRDVPPPKGVPDVVVTMASELWREAQEVANQALVHYRDEANRQVEDAQRLADDAEQHALDSQQREKALAEHLRHTETRLETLNRELATLEANQAQLIEQAERAEQQILDAKKAGAAIEQRYHALQESSQHERQELQTSFEQRLKQEEARNEASEGKLMALLDTLRQERAQEEKSYQKRLQQGEQRIEALNGELTTKQQTLHQLQLDANEREQQLSESQQRCSALEKQQHALNQQLNEAQSALSQQASQHAEQEAQLQQAWQEKLWSRMEALQQQLTELPASLAEKDTTPKR